MSAAGAISQTGRPMQIVACDVPGCGAFETVVAERDENGVGQARRKLQKKGWALVKRKDFCPECNQIRKEITMKIAKTDKTEAPSNVTQITAPKSPSEQPPREPTRAQKRAIMDILVEVYDEAAGRYKGRETDVTVAETLEDGIMPGWVAQLREEFFGPAGGNDEIEALITEIRDRQATLETAAKGLNDRIQDCLRELRALNSNREEIDGLLKRIEAMKKTLGPKAASL